MRDNTGYICISNNITGYIVNPLEEIDLDSIYLDLETQIIGILYKINNDLVFLSYRESIYQKIRSVESNGITLVPKVYIGKRIELCILKYAKDFSVSKLSDMYKCEILIDYIP